jgi:hypothetical protein
VGAVFSVVRNLMDGEDDENEGAPDRVRDDLNQKVPLPKIKGTPESPGHEGGQN